MPLIKDLLPKTEAEFQDLVFNAAEFMPDTFKKGDKVNIFSNVESGIWDIYKFVFLSNKIAAVLTKDDGHSADLPSTIAFLDELILL